MNACDVLPAMTLSVVTPPAALLLTQDEAWQQLRLTAQFGGSPAQRPDSDLIDAMIAAATNELDGPTGWLGRALVRQTLKLTLPRFPAGPILLPCPPLIEVSSVTYLDEDGEEQTLTPTTDYRVGSEGTVAYITPVYGGAFPTARVQGGSVGVTYIAGYGASGADVPELIRHYVRMRLGFYYENRETVLVGTSAVELPGIVGMLENFRVRGVFRP